jgi:hypothetical protein
VAQTCGKSFSIESIAPTDLPDLFTLALLAGNDHLAQSVVQRRLILARDGQARQEVLADAVSGYLQAEPARVSAAEKVAAEADSLAIAEHTSSLPAHEPLLEFARNAFNPSRMLQEAHRIIDLGHTLSFASIQYTNTPIIYAWMGILEVAFFAQPDSVLVYAQQAKTDLKRFPVAGPDWPPGVPWVIIQAFNFSRATPVQVRNVLLPFNPDQYTDLRQLPPVDARYWFPARPKIWPPQGQISLVLYGGAIMRCARGDYNLLVWPTRPECVAWQTSLQDWAKLYSNQGFSLIIVERTEGYAVRSGPLTPDEEADSLNWYYRTYLHLPATLAVVPQVVAMHMPQPDGRRLLSDTTRFGHLLGDDDIAKGHGNKGLAMLFDRKGNLLFAGQFEQNQALIHALIRREFITSSRGN